MKKLLDGTVFEAVNGLWLSGLYGIGAGAKMGLIVGAIVGTIVPIVGNIIGGGIGFVVGGIVGLPAGILGYGIGERWGWRIASGVSCLGIGSVIVRLCYESTMAPYQQVNNEVNRADQAAFFLIGGFALMVFALAGLWLGNIIYNRLKLRKEDFYNRWATRMDKHAVSALSARNRAICVGIALVPVLLTYAQLTTLLCRLY